MAIEPRHRRRWSREEDALLEDLIGTISTRALSRRLGRTHQAIWSRSSYLGLSPHSADGRLTASELARLLDVHVNTVLRWCNRGYLGASRIGRSGRGGRWRVEWDGTGPVRLATPRVGRAMRRLMSQKSIAVSDPRHARRARASE